jgi:hypothetical protein
VNVTVLSYGDDMDMGINFDPAAVEDADLFMDDLAKSFSELVD